MVNRLLQTSSRLFTRQHNNILSAAAVITAAVFLAGIVGVFRNRLLNAYFYNPHSLPDLDAYWAAFRIPDIVFQLLVIGALSAAFIPVFSQYIRKNKQEAYHIASATTTTILVVFAFIALIVFIFAHPLSELITENFTPNQTNTMANLTRIMIIAQLFFAVSNFLTGIIQTHRHFLIPALAPMMYNLGIVIGTILFAPTLGIYGPAIGVVLGAFLHLAIQWPLSRRLGYQFRLTWDPTHPGVKEIGRLMLPRTLALSITQIELTVMVYLATALTSGSLTIFYLAQQLMHLPVRLFGLPIGQASFPFLAKDSSLGDQTQFKATLLQSLRQILYISLPASVILLVLRIPLVRLAYGVKNFPWEATVLTGRLVSILAISIALQAITQILVRAFYALHNTKTPLLIGALTTIINIAIGFFLVFRLDFGILGLAVALSASNFLHGCLLFLFLSRRLGGFSDQEFYVPLIKILAATTMTGVCLWIPFRLLDQLVFDTTRTLPLIALTSAVSTIGLVVYLIFSKLLKTEELTAFTQLASKLAAWKKVLGESEETLESPPQPQE